MASSSDDTLHLLSIHLGSAPSSLVAALSLGSADVEHWLGRARAVNAPLAIVRSPGSIDLYSTEAGRRAAFKPLLESLWRLSHDQKGFQGVRATEASGDAVVMHLLRQAAGLESTEHGESYTDCIETACAQAERANTLSDGLRDLFRLASSTAERSRTETELSAPHSTRASRQIEALSAERILEEELMAFRVAAANDQEAKSSQPAPRLSTPVPRHNSTIVPAYSASEPGSSSRLRIAPFSMAPVTERRSG
jgi:hypothetical protein